MSGKLPQNVEKTFANGDTYLGGWKGGLPEGQGLYRWRDGSFYEGGWLEGAKHGIGKYVWPSGAVYQGEWLHGCMHGYGTLEAPDGSSYQGGWAKDVKQGLGTKIYANGDVYEGLWKHGKPDGPGRYRWRDGNEYDGEWKMGRMHGQGTFVWKSGERYDGEWEDGRENGLGVFTGRDGSTFDGFWQRGRKHGLGVYRPASSHKHVGLSKQGAQWVDGESDDEASSIASVSTPGHQGLLKPIREVSSTPSDSPVVPPSPGHQSTQSGRVHKETLFIKLYENGKLQRESAMDKGELELIFGDINPKPTKVGTSNKQQVHMGETIFKGHRSYDLMLNLQLGIRLSVTAVSQWPMPRTLTEDYFTETRSQRFPREGSKGTPVHPSNDFKWKDYCPVAFRKLREIFGIDAGDYVASLCGDQALRQLNSPGKSGSVFFLSQDGRFLIKTMRHSELDTLLEMLPRYYEHVNKYPHTLMVKFYGLHRVTPVRGRSVRFIVMGNLFQTDLKMHRKYDLKGSVLGRTSGQADRDDPKTILKDLDLDYSFKLEEGWHERLMHQLKADCELMESCRVMDYSLLLGVHFRSRITRDLDGPESGEPLEQAGERGENFDEFSVDDNRDKDLHTVEMHMRQMGLSEERVTDLMALARLGILGPRWRRKKKSRSPTLVLAMRPKRSDTLRPLAYSEGGTDDLAQILGQSRVQLGINMAATAIPHKTEGQAEDVVLYFGIIDILSDWNFNKKVENRLKSIRHNADEISAVDPISYSHRFQKFLGEVFV